VGPGGVASVGGSAVVPSVQLAASSSLASTGSTDTDALNPTLVTPYLVIDFNQVSDTVKQIVHRHFSVVDPDNKVFTKPIISYRRSANLQNSLVNVKRNVGVTLTTSGQLPCSGSRCLLCLQFPSTSNLSFPELNFSWSIRGPADCNSRNCVYLAVCGLCNMKYVGETLNFRLRMNLHNSQQHSTPSCSFFKHRMATGHVFRDFKLYVLRSNLVDKEDMRSWEAFFIDRLHTMHPLGLNYLENI
jgi:hypothetical protein